MTPLGLFLTLACAALVLCLPRSAAPLGLIAAVCFVTEGQNLNVGVFHFTAVRVALLAGVVRVLARGESRGMRFNRFDVIVVAYACTIAMISTLRVGTLEQLVYQLGGLYNIFLAYLVFRCLLRSEQDYRAVLRLAVPLVVLLAFLMFQESRTTHNPFAVFGDVEASSWVRGGQVRSQGPFHSPITAGAFGMTFALLYAATFFAGTQSLFTLIGLGASLLIMIWAHSSGPFLGFVLGLLALACWPLRRHTRAIRWGISLMLLALCLIMKAPVWFILARASDLVGGGGYHRAFLIDQFVNHFDSWWLAGTSDTHDWFPYRLAVSGEADITNAFVQAGVSGGLVGLILFVVVVVRCFQRLGTALKRSPGNEQTTEKMLWGVGSTFVATVGVFFSVTYFDQMQVIWYFLLAYVGGLENRKKQIPKLKRSAPSASTEGASSPVDVEPAGTVEGHGHRMLVESPSKDYLVVPA